MRRWEVFKSGSGIDDASAPSQLFQCAGTELGDSLLKANPNAASGTLTQLLAAMRSLAIIPVAICVLRTELLQLRQERDEPFRTFTAKVRGKAETCSYTASCTCGASVDYTDHVIHDIILNGLYDTEIRREVLGIAGILETPINEIIALVESKEMARNALPSPSLSAVSSFVKQRKSPPNPVPTLSQADRAKEATCPGHAATRVPRITRHQLYTGPQRRLSRGPSLSSNQRSPQRYVLMSTARSSTTTSFSVAIPL